MQALSHASAGRAPFVLGVAAALLSCGCVIGARPVVLPEGDGAAALVLSSGLGMSMSEVARHSWIAARPRGGRWARYEVGAVHRGEDPLADPCSCREDEQGDAVESTVRLHGTLAGHEAERFIACLDVETARYRTENEYVFWPGPNCNTYVEQMLRRCGLAADLPATAIGRDHRGLLGASTTSGGTGVQVESPLFGLKLGLTEGVEVHLLTLPLGVDLWPPALIVPVGAGRLGFDDR